MKKSEPIVISLTVGTVLLLATAIFFLFAARNYSPWVAELSGIVLLILFAQRGGWLKFASGEWLDRPSLLLLALVVLVPGVLMTAHGWAAHNPLLALTGVAFGCLFLTVLLSRTPATSPVLNPEGHRRWLYAAAAGLTVLLAYWNAFTGLEPVAQALTRTLMEGEAIHFPQSNTALAFALGVINILVPGNRAWSFFREAVSKRQRG